MVWTNLNSSFLYGTELPSEKLQQLRDNITAFANGDEGAPVMYHGTLSGLSVDSHSQYHTDTRGDARYYTQTQLNAGQLDSRYFIKSEVITISGNINSNIITDHGLLTGLTDDDHTQYHNDTRGDSRYYTQTQMNAGQMDGRYYTETEIATISGNIVDKIPISYYAPGGTDIPLTDGGTGASDASTARTNLGLGTMATQSSNNVSITGGTISGTNLISGDHGTATTPQVINTIYGTSSTPTVSGNACSYGTIYVCYTA